MAILGCRIIIIVFLLSVNLSAEWIPIDYNTVRDSEDLKIHKIKIGAPPEFYDTGSGWNSIENDFINQGDSLFIADNAILKTIVTDKGVSQIEIDYNSNTYTITQRPIKLVWYNISTTNWIDIFPSGSWPTPSVDSNIIRWTNLFPAVDYAVRKWNGSIEHGVIFKKAFLDSAVTLYDQRSDSLDIALANVMEYTLSNNIDDHDIDIGNLNKRIFKQLGNRFFRMSQSQVHFPGSDTIYLPVQHRWKIIGNKLYLLEFVMMKRIKQIHEAYPNAIIWHNAEEVFDDTDIEDSFIDNDNAGNNHGGMGNLECLTDDEEVFIRVLNVSTNIEAGATITDCELTLYSNQETLDGYIYMYQVFKNWVEGTQTAPHEETGTICGRFWGDATPADKEWGIWTPHACDSADDNGTDNSSDGDDEDRTESLLNGDSVSIINTGWHNLTIDADLAQDWYDETFNENGITIRGAESGMAHRFSSSENGASKPSQRPYWTFTYTVPSEGIPNYVISPLGSGYINSIIEPSFIHEQ